MKTTIRRTVFAATAVAAMAAVSGAASADPYLDQKLVIEGQEMTDRAPAPAYMTHFKEIYSGWLFRTPETRALEQDDFDNPAMVFVDKGLEAWDTVDGTEGKSCASCHEGIESMKGLRVSLPKMNPKGDDLWSMENFINDCRTNRMGAEAWKWNSNEMKNMTAAISLQSRGMPVAVKIDGPAEPYWKKGEEIYYTRFGQLELSCANCHEDSMGNMIRADHLSQGQINGFPTYRLADAGLVSIHQRFFGCIRDTRGEPFEPGSAENRALELYVASRGMGLSAEGVAVRQ